MIIDGHSHIWLGDETEMPLSQFGDPKSTARYMDRWGVDKICALIHFNDGVFTKQKLKPIEPYMDRFILFAWLDPRKENALQMLKFCIDELGFTGLKLHPLAHQYEIDQPGLLEGIFEFCESRRLHTIVHCTSGITNCTPEKLEAIARRYPSATFQLAHTGAIYDGNPSIAAAARTSNLYIDTGIASFNAIRRAVLAATDKIIMGCDWPSYTFEMEMLKCKMACEFADKPEYYDNLIGGNIAKVLKL